MSWNSKGEPVIDVAALYREHKARQVDATIAGKRVGPWLTPPAPKVYEASGPPTDPSALAAWLYARVVPGRTVFETTIQGQPYKAPVSYCTIEPDGRLVVDTHTPFSRVTRLLNPDGTVLWEAS